MAGVNKVILVGHVGIMEVRTTSTGDTIVNLSLATSQKYKDKKTGNDIQNTEWHKCVFFRKPAEIAAKYISKGTQIYVEGSLKTEKWQDQSGIERYTTKIIVRDFQLLGSKKDGERSDAQAPGRQDQQQQPTSTDYQKAKDGSAPPKQEAVPPECDTLPPYADESAWEEVPF